MSTRTGAYRSVTAKAGPFSSKTCPTANSSGQWLVQRVTLPAAQRPDDVVASLGDQPAQCRRRVCRGEVIGCHIDRPLSHDGGRVAVHREVLRHVAWPFAPGAADHVKEPLRVRGEQLLLVGGVKA